MDGMRAAKSGVATRCRMYYSTNSKDWSEEVVEKIKEETREASLFFVFSFRLVFLLHVRPRGAQNDYCYVRVLVRD